jgi:hypothetical protein
MPLRHLMNELFYLKEINRRYIVQAKWKDGCRKIFRDGGEWARWMSDGAAAGISSLSDFYLFLMPSFIYKLKKTMDGLNLIYFQDRIHFNTLNSTSIKLLAANGPLTLRTLSLATRWKRIYQELIAQHKESVLHRSVTCALEHH